MFGLKSHTDGVVYGVIFDISSESIGVSIIESKQIEKLPHVIFSHRVHIRITKQAQSTAEYTRQMREALFSASLIISRDGLEALALHNKHARVQKIFVTCSSPWSYTVSRNVQYEGEDDMRVTRGLIDDLVKSAESEITHQIQLDDEKSVQDFQIVERATVDVRINDYPIHNPVGLKGKSISLAHITGLMPTDIIKAVYEVQEKIFPDIEVRAHTFLLVLYCVLRDLFPKTDSLCIINITGETTEFGIVEGGTLVESLTVQSGTNTVMRSMMESQDRTAVEIASLFELLEAGSLTKTAEEEVQKSVNSFVRILEESMRKNFTTRRFPKTAFILAPNTLTRLLVKEMSPFIQTVIHDDQALLTFSADLLKEISYHDVPDPYLSIVARFFHKLHGCGEIENN